MDAVKKRKLVLHFDLRNTMIVIDSLDNLAVEHGLNGYLTSVAWGAVEDGRWVCKYSEPSLDPPDATAISFYKYLEGVIVKQPDDRGVLRRKLANFAATPMGEHFSPHYHSMKENLVLHHDPHPLLSTTGVDGVTNYHLVLPSFYRLVDHLAQHDRDFSIIIRTFGKGASVVLECCQHALQGHHPMFNFSGRSIPVQCNPGKVLRWDTTIALQDVEAGQPIQLEDELEIYNRLSSISGFHAYVDDFVFWQKNGYRRTSGKPLWWNPHDSETHHIFFDDNIRLQDDDSIVDIRMVNPLTRTAHSLNLDQCRLFHDVTTVQADLIESTANIDFFVDKVKLCEKNFEHLLQSGELASLF